MNAPDAVFFVLLALADICLIAYLRRWRSRYLRTQRMTRSLQAHLQQEQVIEARQALRSERALMRAS